MIFGGTFLALVLIAYLVIGRPIQKYSRSVQKDFALKQAKVREAQELVRAVPNPEAAIDAIRGRVNETQDLGSVKKQIPKLMQLLSSTAAERKVRVESLRPRDDIQSEGLPSGINRVSMEMVIICGYQEMAQFIDALKSLPVVLSVDLLTVQRIPEGQFAADGKPPGKDEEPAGQLQVTLVLSTIFG